MATELLADREEAARALAENRPVDPDVAERIHARYADARERLHNLGITIVAVSLVRSARDE